MDFRWTFVIISAEDTRTDLEPLLYESMRTALLLNDLDSDVAVVGTVYASVIGTDDKIVFRKTEITSE